MKKYLIPLALVALPLFAFGITVPWDRPSVGLIKPLYQDGILVNSASSTITNLTMVNSTSTNATTTNLYISDTLLADNVAATSTFYTGIYIGTSSALRAKQGDVVFPESRSLVFEGDPLTANINGGLKFFSDTTNTKWAQKWYAASGDIMGYITFHEHSVDAPHFSVEVPQSKGGSPNSVFTVDSWCDGSTDNDCGVDVTTGANFYVTSGRSRFGGTAFTDPGVAIGIGTSTPETLFTVWRSSNIPQMSFVQGATSINNESNQWLGEITFRGNDKAAGEDGVGAKIEALASTFWNGTTNDYPADLIFSTTPNGSGELAERLRITSDGNIGIGTSSPYAPLSVVGEIVGAYFTATTTSVNTFPALLTTNATTTNLTIDSLSSALITVDALGITKEFAGTSCTNQFVRALSALGVATCASVDLATDITGTLPVANGGTGQSSFGQGWLNSDGTTITSSTSPTVNYIVATSTIATSTFAGGLTVNGATFTVDASGDHVGFGTTTPRNQLYTLCNTPENNPWFGGSTRASCNFQQASYTDTDLSGLNVALNGYNVLFTNNSGIATNFGINQGELTIRGTGDQTNFFYTNNFDFRNDAGGLWTKAGNQRNRYLTDANATNTISTFITGVSAEATVAASTTITELVGFDNRVTLSNTTNRVGTSTSYVSSPLTKGASAIIDNIIGFYCPDEGMAQTGFSNCIRQLGTNQTNILDGSTYFAGTNGDAGVWTSDGKLLVGTTSTSNLRNFVSTNSLGYGELYLLDPTAANYSSLTTGGTYIRSNEGLLTFQGMRPDTGAGGGVNFTIDQVNTRVGVASSTPKAALSVDNIGSHASFVVNDEASDASPFVINASGNVGIGTTTPDQKIVLDNGSTRGNISLGETAAGNPFIFINNKLAAASKGAGIRFQKNYVNQFGFGTDYAGNGSLDWWVYDYIAAAPRLLIDAAGEVGFGTTSPATKVDIVGTHGTRPSPVTGTLLSLSNTLTTTGNTYASITSGNNAEAGIYLGDQNDVDIGGIIYTHGTDALGFRTNNTANRMTITSAGDVGVATTSPWTTLSVTGTGNFSSKLSLGNVISYYGTAPTLANCGTSPSVRGTRGAGTITMGTSMSNTCDLIFGTAFPATPSCVFSERSGGARFSYSLSINGAYATTTLGVFNDGALIDYHCNEI